MDNQILYTAKFTHHDLKFHKVGGNQTKDVEVGGGGGGGGGYKQKIPHCRNSYKIQKKNCKKMQNGYP